MNISKCEKIEELILDICKKNNRIPSGKELETIYNIKNLKEIRTYYRSKDMTIILNILES